MDSNALQRAILHRFGPEDALVKLSELIFFLGSWELSQGAKTSATIDRSTKTNALVNRTTKKDTTAHRTTAEQKHTKPKSASNTSNTSNTPNTSNTTDNSTSTIIDIATPAISIDLQPSTSLNRPSIELQKAQTPSYAAIAKNFKFQGISASQPPQKPKAKELYKPERLKNSQKQPEAIKVYILDLENLPTTNKALLVNITSLQQRLSIKAIKRVTKRLLLVYPTSIEARQYLINTQEQWLQNIRGTISRPLYNVVIHNIGLDIDLEELKDKIIAQNGLQYPILAASRLGKSTTIRLGLQNLLEANTLIQQGIVLDYEIKTTSLYQKKPIQRLTSPQKANKRYFREPEQLQASQASQSTQDQEDTSMEGSEWSTVDTRKRKALEPTSKRPRGRPRFTAQRAIDQPSLEPFLGPKNTQETQDPREASKGLEPSIEESSI